MLLNPFQFQRKNTLFTLYQGQCPQMDSNSFTEIERVMNWEQLIINIDRSNLPSHFCKFLHNFILSFILSVQ